jgi:hypothetical protein
MTIVKKKHHFLSNFPNIILWDWFCLKNLREHLHKRQICGFTHLLRKENCNTSLLLELICFIRNSCKITKLFDYQAQGSISNRKRTLTMHLHNLCFSLEIILEYVNAPSYKEIEQNLEN